MVQLKYDPSEMVQLRNLIKSESEGETFEDIGLQKTAIGKNLIENLPSILEEISSKKVASVLIVTDETPIKKGAALLRDSVVEIFQAQHIQTQLLVLAADKTGLLHADMRAVGEVHSRIADGWGIVAIGGGTITDICKYAAFLSGNENSELGEVPLIICQTATSGSAFGANQAVIFKDGVKRTLHARYASAIAVDLDVIESAPRNLNIAGFGDMSGILISSVDWYVSHLLGMSEGYSELVVNIMQDSGRALLKVDRQVAGMEAQGIEVLSKILIIMGVVSSLGFGTAPISGFDHMISHALDFEGLTTGRKLSLHGAQVGLGATYAAVAYNFFVQEFSPAKLDLDRCYPSEQGALKEMQDQLGPLNPDAKSMDEIWTHYNEKLILWKKNRPLFEKFLSEWNKPGGPKDQISDKLISAEKIIESLYLSGNPTLPEDLTPPVSPEIMRFAFLNARFMRNRFIMDDIMGFAGKMNDDFWQRVDGEVRRIIAAKRSSG
jgi:glycerol-1-phosphate dehydrogenase [NAD(P)+]